MDVYFEEDGVLTIKAENHEDAERLNRFMDKFQSLGAKLINIDTEVDNQQQPETTSHRQYDWHPYRDYLPPDYYPERSPQELHREYYPEFPNPFYNAYSERGDGGGGGGFSSRRGRDGRGRSGSGGRSGGGGRGR
jgi:uncharacterized membrane protein YgcG